MTYPTSYNSDSPYAQLGPMEMGAPAGSPLKLPRLLIFLRKYWWIPLLTLLLCLSIGIALIWVRPPTFVSHARMWETVKMRLPEGVMFSEDVQNFVGTQTELLKSELLHQQALARLKASSNSVVIPVGLDGEPLPVDIRVTGGTKSSVFLLEATSANPAFTPAYLDALMLVYLEYKKTIRQVVSGDTLASIKEAAERTERELKSEQDLFISFQKTNNLAILQQEGTIAGGYLATLKTKLSDAQLEDRLLQATSLEQRKPNLTTLNPTGDSQFINNSSSPSPGSSPENQTAYKELELLKIQRAKLSENLRPKHPLIVKLNDDIQRAEKLLSLYHQQSQDQLASSRQALQYRIDNIQTSIKEWESKVLEANSRIAEAERLKMNVQRVQNVYDRLLLLVQNVGISRNIDQETLSILEPASPAKRSYSKEETAIALAVVFGLALGLGVVSLIAIRDDRFTCPMEVSERLREVVVGQVPDLAEGKNPKGLLDHNDERHIYAESYRDLRSALLFLPAESEGPKVVLITSAIPHEGKSTVAANLSRTLALGGSRVLLVDGDMRKGRLHDLLGMKRKPGLAEVLRKGVNWEKVLQSNSLPNFFFLSRGSNLENPGDVFLESILDSVLDQWRRQFDYVIIDSSPVFSAADATTLAPKTDGTLFVVRSSFSSARAAREALELLYQRQAKILGVVFNGADITSRSNNYYKYAENYGPLKTEIAEDTVLQSEGGSAL